MAKPSPIQGFLEPWFEALRSQSGVRVRVVGDYELARQKLYRARREALDPRLETLSVVQSPTASDELWIVHSSPPKEPESGT